MPLFVLVVSILFLGLVGYFFILRDRKEPEFLEARNVPDGQNIATNFDSIVVPETTQCCGGRCRNAASLSDDDDNVLAFRQMLFDMERVNSLPVESDPAANLVATEVPVETPVETPVEIAVEPVQAEISDSEPFPSYDPPADDSPASESNSDTGWGSSNDTSDYTSDNSSDGGYDSGCSDSGCSDSGCSDSGCSDSGCSDSGC